MKTPLAVTLTLILAVLLGYGHCLTNGFVYDDGLVIANNTFIRDLSHLEDLFTPVYFPASGELTYRPVVTASYFADYAVFGLATWGYHAHNLLLHLCVVLALLWFFGCLGIRGWPAWIACLIFAVHPAGVESVACPANREELHCALFMLLSLGLLIQGRFTAGACLLFALALFSKETAVVLPLLFFGYRFFASCSFPSPLTPHPSPPPQGERGKSVSLPPQGRARLSARPMACMFITLACYAIVRFLTMRGPLEATLGYRGGTLWSNVITHIPSWARMLKLFIAPTDLNVDFSFPSLTNTGVTVSFALVAVLLIASAVLSRLVPWAGFGLFWIFCTYLPVAGFVPIANVFAERFLYIPLVGLGIFVAGMGDLLKTSLSPSLSTPPSLPQWFPPSAPTTSSSAASRRPTRSQRGGILLFLMCMWILCLGWLTHGRVKVWRNGETLWADAVAKNPHAPRAHNNFGVVLLDMGLKEAAKREFDMALGLDPRFVEAWTNLANYYELSGDLAKAQQSYESVLKITQVNPFVYVSYGDVLYKMGKTDEAEEQYRKALSLRPHFAEALNNLGILLLNQGRIPEAKEKLEQALQEIPRYPDALCNLGTLLAESGDRQGAIDLWKKALKINPYHEGARINLQKVKDM